MESVAARRPLKTRQRAWAKLIAQALVKTHISPNAISIMSVVFAGCAGAAFLMLPGAGVFARDVLLVAAAACIQLRLLANMLDGMVAVEGGLQTKTGEIFNDLPDRISDALILVPAGYAVASFWYGAALGWCAALLAIFTAYVRMLGGAAGLPQSFTGPMAKPHRMATLTIACLLSLFESALFRPGTILWTALIVVNAGCVVTIWRRTARIVRGLQSR
ncbi:MAG: CDP-alcohol phosphatidyltransferase family protein [Actinomycetota bacterium]